jgi:hypothetical protein
MPMVALHEPVAKKILLSPLRVTGATIRGVGHITMGLGRRVHWVGDKVSIRRSEEQKYMPEADYLEAEEAKKKRKEEKDQRKRNRCGRSTKVENNKVNAEKENKADGFRIFNEGGEKTWKDSEDDTVSTVAASLVDEKVEKEFC